MSLRLNPVYKGMVILAIVLGPIVWLVFTEDGRRRTDLVVLSLVGESEINLAVEHLSSQMTESQFRELFPNLTLACSEEATAFGDRACVAQIGSFNAIPSRSLTLYLSGERLRAAKLNYRRSYQKTLERQLTRRVGSPVTTRDSEDSQAAEDLLSWAVSDGILLLPAEAPQAKEDVALIWLSAAVSH